MEKRKTAFVVNKKPEVKNKIYYGQTIMMQRYVDFVWFVEYTKQVIEKQKQKIADEQTLSMESTDVGILITSMELALVQQFTNVDLALMDYDEIIDSDFLDCIVWSFENYKQVLNYFMNAIQILQMQVLFMNLAPEMTNVEDMLQDMEKVNEMLENMPEEQRNLLMNMQLDSMIKDKIEEEKIEKKEKQKEEYKKLQS